MATEKRLLLVGGGHAEIPLIKAAQAQGYYVITSGNRPQDLGHQYGNEYRPADYSNIEAMLTLAEQLDIDAIVPCCNDFAAISCAYVAQKLGLPGHDSVEICRQIHHKDQYRAFAQKHGIASPEANRFDDINEAIVSTRNSRLPVIVKPVDLTGGKGVSKISQPQQISTAITNAFEVCRANRIVVEEFIEGSHHGFSSFIVDGKVVFHFTDNEYYYINPYLVSGASAPSHTAAAAEQELCRSVETIASALNLCDGIVHVQFIFQAGRPVIIEICRRPPGDLYIDLVRHATGLDYAHWLIKAYTGQDCSDLKNKPAKNFILRHCVMGAHPGTLKNIEFEDSIKNKIVDQCLWYKPGDIVSDVLTHKHGIVFLKFDSEEELQRKSETMQQRIKVIVE
ncbi:ATP-grasp domain-containing protein [Pseudomaricurvus alkylphenolicus]|uniref:ATP-grasp domain-containing protein n=1 Tax=Pseudomaricurvus alkylphenolicus TaxID=1306991 RepID=UPI0014219F3F|nr:ATP-grasp domain-containing protein [Pseudomaricurvus alkylphenolicus]NIB40028.1 ATP-grasp domain-containing protein [Pseudomaricurvus alkylphenolicus]